MTEGFLFEINKELSELASNVSPVFILKGK
ncbi:hypothetical protein ES708_19586 [subsurface metagenome]